MTIAIVTYIDCAKTAERIAAALKAHSGHKVTCVDQRFEAPDLYEKIMGIYGREEQ